MEWAIVSISQVLLLESRLGLDGAAHEKKPE